MRSLMSILEVDCEKYNDIIEPIFIDQNITDWTINEIDLKNLRKMSNSVRNSKKQKKPSSHILDLESNTKVSKFE